MGGATKPMTDNVPLYDAFSSQYDYFVNWTQRLRYEMPFIKRQLQAVGARRVLDAACGTGKHVLALTEAGYDVTGADLSTGMIAQARRQAAATGNRVRFEVAGFGQLHDRLGDGFDALLCLGNSLPHVLTAETLHATLADFAAVLRPGGLLLIQSRNFDAVMNARARWIGPQGHTEGDHERLFVRFYDFNPDGTLTFNVVSLQRTGSGPWSQQAEATTLRPWLHRELQQALASTDFSTPVTYRNMEGSPFQAADSSDLVVAATRM
jgi:glycine/sarcosine N-methyltransferase